MLGEITDHESLTGLNSPAQRRQYAGQQLDQSRLAGTVRTQQPQPGAGIDHQIHRLENDTIAITRRDLFQA